MDFSGRHSPMRETEVTLIVCTRSPQAALEQISGVEYIADYRLLPQGTKTIHDYYFDTPGRALSAQRLALRVREVAGRQWLTLKGAPRVTIPYAVERMEIECPWSSAAVKRTFHELVQRGIKFTAFAAAEHNGDALDGMTSLGLIRIQEHTTRRDLRNVVLPKDGRDHTVAELAIDAVVYRFGGIECRHHELEIESKGEQGLAALGAITQGFMTRYHPVLRIWYHSKLATALGLRALLGEGAHRELRDDTGNVLPLAYDKIDAYLGRTADNFP